MNRSHHTGNKRVSDFDDRSPRFCLQDEPNEEAGEQSYHERDVHCNIYADH